MTDREHLDHLIKRLPEQIKWVFDKAVEHQWKIDNQMYSPFSIHSRERDEETLESAKGTLTRMINDIKLLTDKLWQGSTQTR